MKSKIGCAWIPISLSIIKGKSLIKRLICYYALVGHFLLLLLSGCSVLHIKKSPSLVLEKKTKRFLSEKLVLPNLPSITLPEQLNQTDKVNQQTILSYTHCYDWNTAIQPMINKMLQIQEISSGSMLLIEKTISNNTSFSLNLREISDFLHQIFVDNGKFTLVSKKKLLLAKRGLGLLPQDSLGILSKEIGVARNIGAQYILYSRIIKCINALEFQMRLISTQSGEIVWSDKTMIRSHCNR